MCVDRCDEGVDGTAYIYFYWNGVHTSSTYEVENNLKKWYLYEMRSLCTRSQYQLIACVCVAHCGAALRLPRVRRDGVARDPDHNDHITSEHIRARSNVVKHKVHAHAHVHNCTPLFTVPLIIYRYTFVFRLSLSHSRSTWMTNMPPSDRRAASLSSMSAHFERALKLVAHMQHTPFFSHSVHIYALHILTQPIISGSFRCEHVRSHTKDRRE